MHPALARSLGNPIAVPRDSEAIAIVGGVGALMGTALLTYAISPPLNPRPGTAALAQGAVAGLAGFAAFRTNATHPRMATALGIVAILAAFGAAANLWFAARMGASSPPPQPQPQPPAPTP